MEPKEKAISLVQTFIDEGFLPAAARIAALVTVDELIKYIMPDNSFPGYNEWFWQEVKQEIENL